MKKLPDKIGSTLYRETNFMKDLCACVWAEDIEPAEFEERWCSVISSYGLTEHEWLSSMFDMRASWIRRVERCCFTCGVKVLGGNTSDNIPIHDRERNKVYYVGFIPDGVKLSCSCKKFERHGLLCRHALYVLKEQGFEKIPNHFLLSRWSKLALYQPLCGNLPETLNEDCSALEVQKIKLGEPMVRIILCVTIANEEAECIDELMDLLKSFKDKMILEISPSECSSGVTGEKTRNKNKELEMLLGTKIPTEVTVLNPIQSKTKGSGKRLVSQKDKAVQEHKKAPRKCNACGELGFHDSRNCPGKA
ncbi:protein FAR-RED IMPAIRED RESPONSE 1-like [Silene latifolia]|uniref:protein FAR-RED IMPAIRED RESPONSE 1-like n=1 Tax=Silene latifolia TaxID=37657 RepID=UPI003D779F99